MKKCPFCAEDIKNAAIVCKHCKRDLPSTAPTEKPPATYIQKSRLPYRAHTGCEGCGCTVQVGDPTCRHCGGFLTWYSDFPDERAQATADERAKAIAVERAKAAVQPSAEGQLTGRTFLSPAVKVVVIGALSIIGIFLVLVVIGVMFGRGTRTVAPVRTDAPRESSGDREATGAAASPVVKRGGIDLVEACTNFWFFSNAVVSALADGDFAKAERMQQQARQARGLLDRFPDQNEVERVCSSIKLPPK